jgi:hypothetical protein
MEKQRKSSPNHGGARPGAGRKKGSGVKIKVEDLMMDIEAELGLPYTVRVARNYTHAIAREDWARVENYDRALLNKIVADRSEVEVSNPSDAIDAKQLAFQEAMAKLASLNAKAK